MKALQLTAGTAMTLLQASIDIARIFAQGARVGVDSFSGLGYQLRDGSWERGLSHLLRKLFFFLS